MNSDEIGTGGLHQKVSRKFNFGFYWSNLTVFYIKQGVNFIKFSEVAHHAIILYTP